MNLTRYEQEVVINLNADEDIELLQMVKSVEKLWI